ncbi:hypothetical protein N665_0473s0003 [Sinapis alba]|nr:hypothetical protein N665_0473s0003 [Sinapis alba]
MTSGAYGLVLGLSGLARERLLNPTRFGPKRETLNLVVKLLANVRLFHSAFSNSVSSTSLSRFPYFISVSLHSIEMIKRELKASSTSPSIFLLPFDSQIYINRLIHKRIYHNLSSEKKTFQPWKLSPNLCLGPGKAPAAVFFNDITPGRSESLLRFMLIHFWEAKNIAKGGAFLGLELLLIDQQGTVMQGFITPARAQTYRCHLIAGAVYALQNFFATKSKEIYRVADPSLTISFSNDSVLSPLDGDDDSGTGSFPAVRFRFHSHADFEANVGLRGDLYDVVGHLRLVNGQALMTRPLLDPAPPRRS